jgi:hypothetical protein
VIGFDLQHWDVTGQSLDGTLVATVPVAGGEVQRLTGFDTFLSHSDWSPDGALEPARMVELSDCSHKAQW